MTEDESIEHHFQSIEKEAEGVVNEGKPLIAAHYVASMIKHFHLDRGTLTMNDVHRVITAYANFLEKYPPT